MAACGRESPVARLEPRCFETVWHKSNLLAYHRYTHENKLGLLTEPFSRHNENERLNPWMAAPS